MKERLTYGSFIIFSITWIVVEGALRNTLGTNANFGVSVNFNFQYKFCKFLCLKKCSSGDSTEPEEKSAPEPDDYYWRDYYGVIPPDAFKVGLSDQKTQTFVGLVYDPERNGTFVTTIFDGTNYVYNVLKGKKSKLTEHIQILCTMKPERLVWMVLNPEILENLKDRTNVLGHYHDEYDENNKPKTYYHFIVRDSSKPYVGAVHKFEATMEYAKLDGTISSTDQLLWLMFITKEPEGKPVEKLCSYTYDFSFKIGSFSPWSYSGINLGHCVFSCRAGEQSKIKELEKDKRVKTSMEYYWKPKGVFSEKDALVAGYSGTYPVMYIGQGFVSPHVFDVGFATKNTVYLIYSRKQITGTSIYFNVFSTTTPDKFEWVNTTTTKFDGLNKEILIPGGSLSNGTKSYVGRVQGKGYTVPGSIRLTPNGAFLYCFYGVFNEYQVLKLKEV